MLPTAHRLTKGSDFKHVYTTGSGTSGRRIRLKAAPNGLKVTRIGVVVANTVSKQATKRNSIKRMIREALRAQLKQMKPGMDIVVSAHNQAVDATYQELASELTWLVEKAKLII